MAATANPAVPAHLVARGYESTNTTVEQTRLDEAWRALVAEIPSLPSRLNAGQLDAAGVIDVICAGTLRVLRNPEGYERLSSSVDDYREEGTLKNTTDDLYFTRAELRRLQPPFYGASAGSMSYS